MILLCSIRIHYKFDFNVLCYTDGQTYTVEKRNVLYPLWITGESVSCHFVICSHLLPFLHAFMTALLLIQALVFKIYF